MEVIAQGTVESFREAGDSAWRSGDRGVAANHYHALLKLQPCDPAALCRVAVATCLEQGTSNEAVALLLRAAGQPDPPQEVLVWLGYARLAAGDAEKALAALRVATLHPEKTMESEVHLYWALSLMDLGDEVEAAAQFAIAARGHSALRRALAEGRVDSVALEADLPGAGRHLRMHLEALMRQSPACAKPRRGSASRGSTPPPCAGPVIRGGSHAGMPPAGGGAEGVTPLAGFAPNHRTSPQKSTSPARASPGGPCPPRGTSPRGTAVLPTTSPRGSLSISPSAMALQGGAPRGSTPPPNRGTAVLPTTSPRGSLSISPSATALQGGAPRGSTPPPNAVPRSVAQQRLTGNATPISPRSVGATCASPSAAHQACSQPGGDIPKRDSMLPASPRMVGTRLSTSPGSSSRGGPAMTRSATPPPQGGAASSPRDWRASLQQDQAVEVYSRSGSTWMPGSIVQASPEMVKVKYIVDGKWCEKVILRSSENIRIPPKIVTCSVPTTQQFSAAASHQPKSARDDELQQQRQRSLTSLAHPISAAQPRTASPRAVPPQTVAPRAVSPRAVVPQPRAVSPRAVSPRAVSPRQPEPLQAQDLSFGPALGSGTFATVYRGAYRGEEVAIKKLHIQDGQVTPQQLEEFKKEIGNLQQLKHPRLISFIGVAIVSTTLCIITEFMPNGSLFDVLHKRKENIDFSQRALISTQAAEGIAFLHSRFPAFVHRDVKSLNVVMDHGLNAKLCDFGLTQSMEKTHISRCEHDHGGSPRYMAPELFDARLKINEKVDVWALGCLIVETFTGHMPHEECKQIQQVMFKSLVDKVGPFGDLRGKGVDARVISLSDLCFCFEPRQRADAQTVLEGLRGLCTPDRAG